MDIAWVPPADLTLDPRNARRHSDKNIRAIAASIERFGWRKPIVATAAMVVVAGNGSLIAARELGLESVPVATFPGTEDEAKAYALSDNRSAELAAWDVTELCASISDLQAADWDLDLLGFAPKDLVAFQAALGKPGPDAFPEDDEDVPIDYRCPACRYEWSGRPKP